MNEQTTSELFKKSIKNGTGEAILLLKENPSVNFDQYILYACTHNLAYDPQCEGTRKDYLFEILSLSSERELLINQIIRKLNDPDNDYWNTQLLFDLVAIIAKHGNQNAHQAIYKRYINNLESNFEFIETDVVVELDGLKGLEFITEIQGKKLEIDSDYWVDDLQLHVCKENYPETSPREHLEKNAINNKYINLFLAKLIEIEHLRKESKSNKRNRSLSYLLERIEKGKKIPIIAGKWLNEDEVAKVANLLLKEKSINKIEPYLRLLARANYPLDIGNLLPLLSINNKTIKHYLLKILGKISDSRIRNLIDKNCRNYQYLYEHLEFFISNFHEKDLNLLCDLLETINNKEEIHYFGMVVRDILEKNEIRQPGNLLNSLYNVTNCSICREAFLRILTKSQKVSDKVLREMKYDCEPDIRQMALQYLQKY